MTTLLIAECPRCNAQRMTFDLHASVYIESNQWECLFVCRACNHGSLFKLHGQPKPEECALVNERMMLAGHITAADLAARSCPGDVPKPIGAAFTEGAKCLAIGCHNAAAAMFRLALDIATRALLPSEAEKGLDTQTKRNLGRRLKWLFANKKLPEGLKDLASIVRDDGNDGAHSGTVDAATAEDLIDFTERFLTQMYTEPAKIKAAKKRSDARKKPAAQPRA